MWKTQHMALLAVAVTIVSVTLTLFAHSRINQAIAAKAEALASPASPKDTKTNPIQLMSALSSKKIRPDDKSETSIPPPSVRFEEPQTKKETPKGAGVRWTPL